jgi:hypothetical protein
MLGCDCGVRERRPGASYARLPAKVGARARSEWRALAAARDAGLVWKAGAAGSYMGTESGGAELECSPGA